MLDTKTLVAAMARRCGLEDPDRFALAGGVAAKSSAFRDAIARLTGKPWAPPKDLEHALRLRGTGRTTRMLLEVLVALQCGCKVDIVTYNDHAAVDLGSDLVALASITARHHLVCSCAPRPCHGSVVVQAWRELRDGTGASIEQ